jgi:translocation and assembly module TamA
MSWSGAAAALATLMLAGCAALGGKTAPADAEPGAPGAAGAAAPARASATLEVVAPPALKALLEKYLDIARVGSLTHDDSIDDSEWSRLIDAAPAQARELLQTEGYFEPRIVLTREPDAGGAQHRVKLVLEPGPRVHISRVTLDVEGELERAASAGNARAVRTLAELRSAWALPAGQPFRNPAWEQAKAAALARLRAAGYASATWSGTGAEIDAPTQQARLFVVADSGPLYRFGELEVEGLAAQDLQTVKNLANFRVGTPVSETLLLDYQDRLQKAGLFDSATVTLDPDPAHAGAARIHVRVSEAPLQVYTFGVGISANTGPRASVEHLYRRVFGFAATSRNKLEWGGLRQAWDGELSSHPGEGLYRYVLGGTVERLQSDTDVVLSQRVHVGRTQDMQRRERYYFLETERSEQTTDSAKIDTLAFTANYHLILRRLDDLVLPTKGYTLSLQGNLGRSRGTNAETGPFSRLYGRFTGYLPLGGTWYGQARLELGQVVKKDAVAVPQSQLFRAGGDDSVRGYGYRSLGPLLDGAVTGGTTMMTTSIEFARPVSASLPSVWGAVFADAGNASDGFKSLHPVVGVGVGVRWRSPVGPLRLDWAYGEAVHSARLHFSVGIAF